jgi:hypothetical protein
MSQRRREFLAATAGAVALTLAGCSDGGSELNAPPEDDGGTPTPTDPTPNLDIVDFSTPTGGDGAMSVDVTVENTGDEASSATLVVTAYNDDDEVSTETPVSLDPGDSETYTVTVDVDPETYEEGQYGFRFDLAT